jgi:beta-N-acetylhexosaminidase
VLDVATNQRNPAIGDRALSDQARVVAEYGRIIIEALQGEGIAACGKHFPGHGDTTVDSHLELPVVDHPPDRFAQLEFVPFEAAIAADVALVMMGHLLVPAFDDTRPASLSPVVIRDRLRDQLGFTGVVCTDDMDMKAITAHQPVERAAVAAVGAGCDLVLSCGADVERHARVMEALIRAAEEGELRPRDLDDARIRQRRAKERFLGTLPPRPPSNADLAQMLGRADHVAVAEAMAAFA